MALIIEATAHQSASVSESNSVLAVGIVSHGETFNITGYLQVALTDLSAAEQEIANDFINMITSKISSDGSAIGGS